MSNEEKPKSHLSALVEMGSKAIVKFEPYMIDPHIAEIRDYLSHNKLNLEQEIRKNLTLWNKVYSNVNDGVTCVREFDRDGFKFVMEISLETDNQYPEVKIFVLNPDWYKEKSNEFHRVFPVRETFDRESELIPYDVEDVANRLGVQPMEDFKAVNPNYSPKGIVDLLGKGMDSNIIELVRLFNMFGFETSMSCGGHKDKSRNPYIHVEVKDRLKDFISFVLAWKKAGGLTSNLEVLQDNCLDISVDSICIFANDSIPVKKAQTDIDRWTDFLREKVKGMKLKDQNVYELVHGFRRKMGRLLGRLMKKNKK